MNRYAVGIIGAGLQAKRRIPALLESKNTNILGIASKTYKNAKILGEKYKIPVFETWRDVVKNKKIDIIVITTYPDSHKEIAIEAFKNNKHVLCEKPLAMNIEQAKQMIESAKSFRKILKCGFNHRFHPAILDAKEIIEKNTVGNLLYGRGVYGYIGRQDIGKEWRSNTKYAAGGILMEQGIHVIDLCRWFFGEFQSIVCFADTLYFPIKPFEDSAFVVLKTKQNQTISIHSTTLQWKNTFMLEIYGTEGYLKVVGLGGSYGTEKLIVGKKDYYGPFKESITEYRGGDGSWKKEWEEFLMAIENKNTHIGDGMDGLEAMRIIESAYTSSKKKKVITI